MGACFLTSVARAIHHADEAIQVFDGQERSRYTAALVLLAAIEKSLRDAAAGRVMLAAVQEVLRGEPSMLPTLDTELMGLDDNEKRSVLLTMALSGIDVDAAIPLADLAHDAWKYVADDWHERGLRSLPPSGVSFRRSEWGARTKRVVELFLEHGQEKFGLPDDAIPAALVNGVVNALRTASAIPELRDLVRDHAAPVEHQRMTREATRSVTRYMLGTNAPDAEAVIRRVLIAFGYPQRQAHSLFEAESKRVKPAGSKRA